MIYFAVRYPIFFLKEGKPYSERTNRFRVQQYSGRPKEGVVHFVHFGAFLSMRVYVRTEWLEDFLLFARRREVWRGVNGDGEE